MNPQILAILQQHGFFSDMQPTVPVAPTPSPASLLGSVGATPNYGGMNGPIAGPTAAPLPPDPAKQSFQQKYAPMFQAASSILGHSSSPAPAPQPFLHPFFWHPQGGGY